MKLTLIPGNTYTMFDLMVASLSSCKFPRLAFTASRRVGCKTVVDVDGELHLGHAPLHALMTNVRLAASEWTYVGPSGDTNLLFAYNDPRPITYIADVVPSTDPKALARNEHAVWATPIGFPLQQPA
jgi:hypothetical protein